MSVAHRRASHHHAQSGRSRPRRRSQTKDGQCRQPADVVRTRVSTTTSTPSAVLSPTPSLFSPTSVWNQQVPATAPLDPSSASVVSYLNSFVTSSETAGTGPWINTTSYSTPIYTVPAGQATAQVFLNPNAYNDALESALSAVPIPAGAQPAAGSDAQMVVYQPSTNSMWEFWGLHQSLLPPAYVWGGMATGGNLAAGEYVYAVTALSAQGETTPSTGMSINVQPGQTVTIQWDGVPGAIGYKIYRGGTGQALQLVGAVNQASAAFNTVSWTDRGTEAPAAAAPPRVSTAATPGQWHAGWGGRMLNVSTDPGYYRNLTGTSGNVVEQASWGATASSLPIAAGLITLADLASGQINHAIAMMVPKAKAKSWVCPARRTDGDDSSPNAIPEGAHFRLNPALNLSTLSMPPITRMIAVAAQKYGLIVNDQTGVTVGFRAEDPSPLTRTGQPNPYLKYFVDSSGRSELPTQLLASFPWAQLQLLTAPGCS